MMRRLTLPVLLLFLIQSELLTSIATLADCVGQCESRLPLSALYMLSRQISFGLHDLLRQNAANVHKREHWVVLFALLEASGAAVSGEDSVEDAATSLPGEQEEEQQTGRGTPSRMWRK